MGAVAADAAIALSRTPSYRDGNHGARSMLRRLLNLASIVCLVACVTLMGMWVRSYRWVDELHGPIVGQQTFTLTSRPGRLLVTFDKSYANTPPVKKDGRPLWSLNS